MDGKDINQILKEQLGENLLNFKNEDIPVFEVKSTAVYAAIKLLKEHPELDFQFLTDLCGIHYPENELEFGVIYHLHNLRKNFRVRIKTFVSRENCELESITPLFSGANWMERETFDFYGIVFTNHPNLKRILNVEYLDFFPLRKEYPLEDPTREDKDNRFFGRDPI